MRELILAVFLLIIASCSEQNIINIQGNDSMIRDYVDSNDIVVCFGLDSDTTKELICRSIESKDERCLNKKHAVRLTNAKNIPVVSSSYKEFLECTGVIFSGGGITITLDDKFNILLVTKNQ